MREEIEDIINNKLDGINSKNNGNEIKEMVDKQNEIVSDQKKRQVCLSILQEANARGVNINYNEKMSTEELENLAKSVEV